MTKMGKVIVLIAFAICIGGAVAVHSWEGVSDVSASSSGAVATEVQSSHEDLTTIHNVFGIRFAPQTVGSDVHPVINTGGTGISMGDAVSAAMGGDSAADGLAVVGGQLFPNVRVTAQYGMFSNDVYGPLNSSGQVQPRWQNIPAWIVTFAGPGVSAPSHGRIRVTRHEVNVVVDAVTGVCLQAFIFR